MSYQVLARSWRPQTFDDVLGQEAVVTTLRNAIGSGTLGHAYLFSGLRGVGKTTAARLLSKAVNCAEGPTPTPCGECPSCVEIAAGSSVDVIEIDGATHTGIDQVRDLQELLRFRPTRDRYRVVVIDEVHMLSASAFNALLKSIEEPPDYVLWIFATTERHKVPATILSRCQQLEFRPLAAERIAEHLRTIADAEGFELTSSAAGSIARAARGSVRDGLSLLDQLRAFSAGAVDDDAVSAVLGVPQLDALLELVMALAGGDAAAGLDRLRAELVAGRDPSVLYHELGRLLRTLVQQSIDRSVASDYPAEHADRLGELATELGTGPLTRMIGLWVEQEPLLRASSNRELALEVACLRLARWQSVRQLEALLQGGGEVIATVPTTTDRGPAGSTPSAGEGSSHPPGSAGERLAKALWEDHPRLAGAVEAAAVEVDGDTLRIRFESRQQRLGAFLDAEPARRVLAAVADVEFPDVVTVVVEVDGQPVGGASGMTGLEREARSDPQVALALEVLGGEVQAVRSDREPS